MQIPPDELVLRADGRADPRALADVAERALGRGATDVLLLAHGWDESHDRATALHADLAGALDDRIAGRDVGGRVFAAVGVVWPSLRWADRDGGGPAGSGSVGSGSVGDDVFRLHETIGESVDDPAVCAELRALATVLDTPAGRARFVDALRRLLPPPAAVADDDCLPGPLAHGDAEALFALVADALGLDVPARSPLAIARRLLNLTTYYAMKDRSGAVGRGAVARLVEELHAQDPAVRVHLAGHSFGARVVSGAASSSGAPVRSMTLLQGAFSHLAFAPAARVRGPGAFRRALTHGVTGPVVVTHTHQDRVVTLAYAIASRVARQLDVRLGGTDDPYGGIGANGAVETPEAVPGELLAAGAAYAFTPRHVHNLRADAFVADHGDVRGPEVANALLQAMLAG